MMTSARAIAGRLIGRRHETTDDPPARPAVPMTRWDNVGLAVDRSMQVFLPAASSVSKRLEGQGEDFLFWVPTLIFYVGVQILDARLADDNIHPRMQGDRVAYARTYSTHSTGPAGYKDLKTLSESWRYEARAPHPDEIERAWRWAQNLAAALKEPWPPE